ncbi:MAG TPA: tRNA 2-thiocytidine(32) synthetase TtcA, partial [Gammaproteobacteria bacterium]|nr:tRNA 2-thiocytidine(32) synthetase TtcA [Gammaproteobacteria bacterium]
MTKPSAIEKKLLHYTGKAISEFNMIQAGDRIMVCLSGGKDSFTMLKILSLLQKRADLDFELFAFTLDQAQPGWNDAALRAWLEAHQLPYEVLKRDT